MKGMSSIRHAASGLTLAVVVAAPFVVGCAHTEQAPPPQDRVVLAVATPPAPMPETAFQPDAPAARPRLSQTVTLGATESGYPAPAAQGAPGGGPTVVVNNNIVVYANQPPVYGGYYYGYGGYGYGGGDGYGAAGAHHAASPGSNSFGGYSNTGPTTAAPGHTPGVGGNWSPAPSYGPRQMR